MLRLPVLMHGPLGLDLDKSVRYIVYGFKGISCGVVLASFLAFILIGTNLSSDNITDDQTATLNRQLILSICICGFAIAYFFLCSYLNKGVEERNRTWIFPWFLVTAVVGFVLIIIFIASFFNDFAIIQLILPIIIVLVFYCDLIVYSFYVDLGTNFIPETPPTQVVPA